MRIEMIEKILAAVAVLALFLVIGAIIHNEFFQNEVTIMVDLKQGEDPFVAIRHIVPSDSAISSVRQINPHMNQYELIVRTKREKQNLLEWLTRSHRVEQAELK